MIAKKIIQLLTVTALAAVVIIGCNSDAHNVSEPAEEAPAPISEFLERQGKLAEAPEWAHARQRMQKLLEALEANPSDHESRLLLALAYMQEARVTGEHPHYYPAALSQLDYILSQEAEMQDKDRDIYYESLVAKASVLLSLHQFAEALKVAEKAVRLNPYDADAYGALGDANVELGNYEQAVAMADKMTAIRPDMASYSRVSYLREIHGNLDGAIQAMDLAVKAGYPGLEQTAWARVTLAALYLQRGDYESAEGQLRTALENRPDYPFAIAALGEIALAKGELEKAEALIRQACEVIPEVGFYSTLAAIHQQQGNAEEVAKLVDDILAMMAEDEAAGHEMSLDKAKVLADLDNDPDRALETLAFEYAHRPANIDVRAILAQLYYQKGEAATAATHMREALRTRIKNPEWLCLAGLIEHEAGNPEKGKALMQEAFAINPQLHNDHAQAARKLLKL